MSVVLFRRKGALPEVPEPELKVVTEEAPVIEEPLKAEEAQVKRSPKRGK